MGRRLRRMVHTLRSGVRRREKLLDATRTVLSPLGNGEDVGGEAVWQGSPPGTAWRAGWVKVEGRLVAGTGSCPAKAAGIGTSKGADFGSAE